MRVRPASRCTADLRRPARPCAPTAGARRARSSRGRTCSLTQPLTSISRVSLDLRSLQFTGLWVTYTVRFTSQIYTTSAWVPKQNWEGRLSRRSGERKSVWAAARRAERQSGAPKRARGPARGGASALLSQQQGLQHGGAVKSNSSTRCTNLWSIRACARRPLIFWYIA